MKDACSPCKHDYIIGLASASVFDNYHSIVVGFQLVPLFGHVPRTSCSLHACTTLYLPLIMKETVEELKTELSERCVASIWLPIAVLTVPLANAARKRFARLCNSDDYIIGLRFYMFEAIMSCTQQLTARHPQVHMAQASLSS